MGYDIRLELYTDTETWRDIRIPENLNLKQFHQVIQKVFGFYDYHMWNFNILKQDSENKNIYQCIKTISDEEAEKVNLNEIFDKYTTLVYQYDFGDEWEIIINKSSENDYNNKTALILDYCGKYNPLEDMGGFSVFEEIMEYIDDEDLDLILEDYGLSRGDLSKMDFEKRYKKGSRIRIK